MLVRFNLVTYHNDIAYYSDIPLEDWLRKLLWSVLGLMKRSSLILFNIS
jgi:hypothetical protein